MFRHLRIAILPLIAAAVMPTPYGMAEEIDNQRQISTNLVAPPLVRVQNAQTWECRRQCDVTFAACQEEVRYAAQTTSVSEADVRSYVAECMQNHRACYAAC